MVRGRGSVVPGVIPEERARNRERKARPEAPDGRGGYKRKRRSDRSGARSRIGARYSGTGSEQKAPDRCRTSSDAGRIQKTDRRGKAPCCVAASTNDARVSTWRKGGQVRNAKDPAPASRRPARRPQTLGDRKSRSSPVKGDDHTGKRLAGKPHEPFERADGGRATARPPPTLHCGNPERHEYELYLALEDVDHSRTKTKSPQTNGIVERFHKTVLDEFYRVAFRKRIYGSIAELQADLDEWIRSYNEDRPHQGRWCFGKTPMQTFLDAIPLAKEKMIAA